MATSDESEASAPPTVDFFISYAAADRARAEWIARQLQGAGYRVLLQAWHFRPGDNFVVRMMESLEAADRIVAVISQAYLDSPYGQDEWTSAFVRDESGRNRLLCVRIENCRLPRLLATRVYVDLTDVDEATARARLLAAAGS